MKITKEIIIFQAPYASLVDCGLLKQLYPTGGAIDKVSAQYYMPVFHDTVALEVENAEVNTLLEGIYSIFNQSNRPNAMTMRSLSAGDVICMDGTYYLVRPIGYAKVKFEAPVEGSPDIPKPESREDFGRYLKEKYNINGKAATMLDNILEYNNDQGGDPEEESAFLEAMLSGLGVSAEDRELFIEKEEE